MKNDKLYLQDMLDAIEKIQSYTESGDGSFFGSPLIQDAVIRNMAIVTIHSVGQEPLSPVS